MDKKNDTEVREFLTSLSDSDRNNLFNNSDGMPKMLNSAHKEGVFEREDRYTIIKNKDLHHLSNEQRISLMGICLTMHKARILNNKRKLQCVVVEDDWPEYDIVWEMIRDRSLNKKGT